MGMALLNSARVLAFELDPVARKLCRQLAHINKVQERIDVVGRCTIDALALIRDEGKILVICDCEGFEYKLLYPERIPWLKHCDLLVELHRADNLGDMESFMTRFQATHTVERISTRPRDPSYYPELEGWDIADQENALGEFRAYHQEWAILTARA